MIVVDEEVAGWVTTALRERHMDPKRFRDAEMKKLNSDYKRIETTLDTLYDDALQHRIGLAFFERKSSGLRDEQSAIRRNLERHQTATESFMEAGVRIIELPQRLPSLLVKQLAHEKTALTRFRSIELLLERWPANSNVPATF
jgi:site-specific DNA recombinase